MNEAVKQKLTRARTALILDAPFYGQLALRLNLVPDDRVPTLAVDGKHIFYNEKFVDGLSFELTKSALGHEVMHCVFDHIGRRGGRTPKKWNQAGDYVINATLKDSGFEIGPNWLYNAGFANMSTDEIYNLLPDPPDDGSGGGNGHGDPLDEAMDGDPSDTEVQATDWKIAAVQAATEAAKHGKLPGSLKRFVDEITSPKVDWRAVLRQFVTERSRDDYSWMRPSRRLLGQGIFLPGLYSESMGDIVCVIDTSGSITQQMLNLFGSEIKGICDNARPNKIHVIYCDAEVNHVDEFTPNDELTFKMHGGGGTDFRPPFEYVKENNITPVCLVYLTDMYGAFGDEPEFPVMWCATTEVQGPWGTTLQIEA